ncbi:hypothetical protein QUA08_02930 [Microcoleus sp. T3B2]
MDLLKCDRTYLRFSLNQGQGYSLPCRSIQIRGIMLVVADPRAIRAIEAPETAASTKVMLPIAIEQMRRGEIKTLQFILLSPSQFFEPRTTELGLTAVYNHNVLKQKSDNQIDSVQITVPFCIELHFCIYLHLSAFICIYMGR